MGNISFNELPEAIAELITKVTRIEALLKDQYRAPEQTEVLLTIEQAADFLNLSVTTLYGFTQRATIPYCKQGKKLYFSQKELLGWIKSGRKKTKAEIITEAEAFLSKAKRK